MPKSLITFLTNEKRGYFMISDRSRHCFCGLQYLYLAALCLVLTPIDAAEVDFNPTANEIMALKILNDHRRSYLHGDMRIKDLIRRKILPGDMSSVLPQFHLGFEPMSPVVINPQLMAVAHALLKARPAAQNGFTYDCTKLLADAKYQSAAPVFALVGLDAAQLEHAYARALVFPYRVTDKRVGVMSRQIALADKWREAGVAVETVADKTSMVIILGEGTAVRYGGGVVFKDSNRNGAYDPGEGKAGVTVTIGSSSFVTEAGGAWWMALNAEEGSKSAQVTFSASTMKAVREVPPGAKNFTVDWHFPQPADLVVADRLIAECVDEQKVEAQGRSAAAKLFMASRGLDLDDERIQQIQVLTVSVASACEELVAQTLKALAEEPDEWRNIRSGLEKPWKGSLRQWFQDAESTYQAYQVVKTALAAPPEKQRKLIASARKLVDTRLAATIDPALIEQLLTWKEQLESLQPADPVKADPKKR